MLPSLEALLDARKPLAHGRSPNTDGRNLSPMLSMEVRGVCFDSAFGVEHLREVRADMRRPKQRLKPGFVARSSCPRWWKQGGARSAGHTRDPFALDGRCEPG